MNSLGRYLVNQDGAGDNGDIHVRYVSPRCRVEINSSALVVDTTRTKLLKQANHAGTSRLMYSPKHCKIGEWTVSLTPPLNHVMRGAVLGFVRAAKNQNLAVKHR
jgi:hypothetical protein